jgi:hypothetical protein
LSRCDDGTSRQYDLKLPDELPFYLERGFDVGRSLWDREALIAHLDIEYTNFDFHAEPYLDIERSFELQQPVVKGINTILQQYEITPLHLLTGRGHHFVWKIRRDSQAYGRLSAMARMSEDLGNLYREPHPPGNEPVPVDMGAAFSGLGLTMEYLTHRIKEAVAPVCRIPIKITAVAVGPIDRGREIISLDISEYADPLHTRVIRVPFSVYWKPHTKGITADPNVPDHLPQLITIPKQGLDFSQMLHVMRNPEQVVELARRTSARIPDCTEPMNAFITAYQHSPLKSFHDWFYAQEHESPQMWTKTYDQTPLEALPPCVQFIVQHPNDWLLKPAGIELVVRVLLAVGWHPRHIAGLIRSKYERNYAWGPLWYTYEAGSRADFYTRLFAGLAVTGQDTLIDFNCYSTKEKGFCFSPDMSCNLTSFNESLQQRRHYDRLAHRPFNRLFLSEKHL